MKRIGFVYDKLLDKEFIKQTIQKASKHKTKRKAVQRVLANIDKYTDKIYEMIANDNIRLKPTHNKIIKERGKQRKITVSPFYPNQILDYLLVELVKPTIKKGMYPYCVGNVDKRGIMFGKKIIERNIKKYRYFMKLDIRHFYENVNPQILVKMIERKIKDKKFVHFTSQVISQTELPIGCYYSQWLSNFFLESLDHYIKEQERIDIYIRYVDDMILGGNNKRKLRNSYYQIKKFLEKISLELKFNPTIRKPLNFLGFVFDNTHTKLRHKLFYRLQKTIKKASKHLCFSLAKRLTSFFSWLKNLKSGYNYYINNIFPTIKLGKLRHIMSCGGI